MLDKYIQQLTKELELEGSLATEVPGVYAVPVTEDISVILTEIPRGFTLTCTFEGVPTEEKEEEFYTAALFANLYGQGTDGSVLGLDEEAKHLVLSRKIDYPLEYPEFRDLIEDFLNAVDFWIGEASTYRTKIA